MRMLPSFLLAALLLPLVAAADPPPKGAKRVAEPPGKAAAAGPGLSGQGITGFARREADLIRSWFAEPAHVASLPPGLAKRDRLPPGLEKQLRRNGTLPPGLEKKLHALPDDLVAVLPPLRGGLRRVILGEHVILLDERTSSVVDILHGVARLADSF